jgi:hypothetical protein
VRVGSLGRAPRRRLEQIAPAAGRAGEVPRYAMTLAAGDFTLLRLDGDQPVDLLAGAAPTLTLAPNPARGAVSLAIAHLGADATVQILDAAGRRVWQRSASGPNAALDWRGESDRGGAAPAGLYFARVEDARGVAVKRFAWLGR